MRSVVAIVTLATLGAALGCGASTTGASTPVTAPAVAAPSPSTSADPAPDSKPTVELVVDADSPRALVERRTGTDEQWQTTLGIPSYTSIEHWEQACVTPCRVRIDPHATYRVGGDGVAPSPRFQVPQGRDSVRLHVHTRSGLARDIGVGLSVTGIAAIGLGSVGLVAASTVSNYVTQVDIRTAAYVSIITGVVFLAIGLPLWLIEHSTVTTESGEVLGATPRATPPKRRFVAGALVF